MTDKYVNLPKYSSIVKKAGITSCVPGEMHIAFDCLVEDDGIGFMPTCQYNASPMDIANALNSLLLTEFQEVRRPIIETLLTIWQKEYEGTYKAQVISTEVEVDDGVIGGIHGV